MKSTLFAVIVLFALVTSANADLLAHWSFDTDFTDSAGTFDLTAAGGAGIDTDGGKIGGAVSLNSASSQYASVTFTENAMFTPGEDYTVMAWYKLNVADITGTTRYMVFESGANYTASYGLRDDATLGDIGQVYVVTGSTAANMVFSPGENEEWHHIAVTYNHSTGVVNAYVDGELANTLTKSGALKASTSFYIGTYRSHNGRYFEGLIDDVAVFDNVVSVADIEYYAAGNAVEELPEPEPEPATLLAHWSFDADWTANDSLFNLTPHNGADIVSGGKISGAACFNRALSQYAYVDFSDGFLFNADSNYTVVGWYYLDVNDINETDRYFVFESGPNYSASFGLRDKGTGDIAEMYTRTVIDDNYKDFSQTQHKKWYHIAITYDHLTGVYNAYIDGVLAASMTQSGALASSARFVIGGHRDLTGRNFNGMIDDVAVFNGTLSTDDIEYLAAGNAVPEPNALQYIAGDINKDRKVNFADIIVIFEQWLNTGPDWLADVNNNEKVDFVDYAITSSELHHFTVEDTFNYSSSLHHWTIVDEGLQNGPSNWQISAGQITESSDILGPEASAVENRKGTYLYWNDQDSLFWADYQFNVLLRNTDDDGIGVIFRYKDPHNYYKFEMDKEKNFRKLFKMYNGVETTLASLSAGFTQDEWMQLSVDVEGEQINILLDETNVFGGAIIDSNISGGTIALYDWGSQNSYFDNFWVHIKKLKSVFANNDSYYVVANTTLDVASNGVLSNDTTASGSLTASLVIDAGHGDVSLNTDGTFTYTPDTNYVGLDSFVYKAANGDNTDEATVTIRVRSETEFTIVVLPDTQCYSTSYPEIYALQTQWIVDNKDALNIKFVLHEGDITNNNTVVQWDNADAAMNILDGNVPYVITVGNHDIGTNGSSNIRDNTLFNQYFPADRFDSLVGTFEPNKVENSYHYFTAGGIDWLVLALEFGPRNKVLDWANTVITNHPNHRVMVLTHNYMYYDDTRVGAGDSSNPHNYGLCNVSDPNEVCNDGEEMWTNFVKLHKNISFVFSGHILGDGVGTLVSTGDNANSVYQMLANYQMLINGGNGWLRILKFDPDLQKVTVETYSPYLDEYDTAPNQQFEFTNVDLTAP